MKRIYILLAIAALILTLTGCGRGRGPALELAEEVQPVTVEELTLRELDDYVTVSGKLEGIVNITMSSETSGRVVEVYKKLGQRINRGERIGKVENDVYRYRLDQAEAGFASAQLSFDTAERNLAYAEESFRRNLISQAEYNGALTAFQGAKAVLDGARAGLETARTGVSGSYFTAPETGTISYLNIAPGQYVMAGSPVATITDASRLLIKTGVGESQIAKLQQGQIAEISHPDLPGTVRGSVRGFGISPLANSASYPVEIELASTGSLLPGMVVSARILTRRYAGLLYTSITNFSNEFGTYYAYVVDSDNQAHRRKVTLGRIIGENAFIESGLEVGELIVTSGAENLEEGRIVEIRNQQ